MYYLILSFCLSLIGSERFNLIQPEVHKMSNPSLFDICRELEKPDKPVVPEVFNKNSYNPHNKTVWRERRVYDNNHWYYDEANGVYWRHYRADENPETIGNAPRQPQIDWQQYAPIRTQNCPT